MREQIQKVMTDWGFDVNADTACGNLTVEQRQVVEITRGPGGRHPLPAARRAHCGARAQRLFERIRQLQAQGVAILYISHHLEEVFEICTDVAVLRDGEMVLTAPIPEVTKDDLVAAMVGQENLLPNEAWRQLRHPRAHRGARSPNRPHAGRRRIDVARITMQFLR